MSFLGRWATPCDATGWRRRAGVWGTPWSSPPSWPSSCRPGPPGDGVRRRTSSRAFSTRWTCSGRSCIWRSSTPSSSTGHAGAGPAGGGPGGQPRQRDRGPHLRGGLGPGPSASRLVAGECTRPVDRTAVGTCRTARAEPPGRRSGTDRAGTTAGVHRSASVERSSRGTGSLGGRAALDAGRGFVARDMVDRIAPAGDSPNLDPRRWWCCARRAGCSGRRDRSESPSWTENLVDAVFARGTEPNRRASRSLSMTCAPAPDRTAIV